METVDVGRRKNDFGSISLQRSRLHVAIPNVAQGFREETETMKVVDEKIWKDFEMLKELEHYTTVEAQYVWGWRIPLDGLPKSYRRYRK